MYNLQREIKLTTTTTTTSRVGSYYVPQAHRDTQGRRLSLDPKTSRKTLMDLTRIFGVRILCAQEFGKTLFALLMGNYQLDQDKTRFDRESFR